MYSTVNMCSYSVTTYNIRDSYSIFLPRHLPETVSISFPVSLPPFLPSILSFPVFSSLHPPSIPISPFAYTHTSLLSQDHSTLSYLLPLLLIYHCFCFFLSLPLSLLCLSLPLSLPKDLKIPLCRTVHAQRSVSMRGVIEWNDLPHQTKALISINSFKSNVRLSLLESYEHLLLAEN